MRIIAGRWGGRALATLPEGVLRPTQDRVREGVFAHLESRLAGALIVDLYAGSGALGLEALSRGAARVVFVDRGRVALRILRKNIAGLGVAEEAVLIAASAEVFLAGRRGNWGPVGMLFADPPYGTIDGAWLGGVASAAGIEWAPAALLILESSCREEEPAPAPGWRRCWRRWYGETRVVVDERESEDG